MRAELREVPGVAEDLATDSQSLEGVAALALIEAHDKPSASVLSIRRSASSDRSHSASLWPVILGRANRSLCPPQLKEGSWALRRAWTRTRTPDDERGEARDWRKPTKGGMRYNVRELQGQ